MTKQSNDEEVLEGPLKAPVTPEERAVAEYKTPKPHRILFKRRVFEIEEWCSKQGLLERDEVIAYVETKYHLYREQAMEYVDEVINDFRRMGLVYGQQANAKR